MAGLAREEVADMHEHEKRVLARHLLENGLGKAATARELGIGRRTLYRWLAEKGSPGTGYARRRKAPSILDGYKLMIERRLAEDPTLTAKSLYREVRTAGFTGGYDVVRRFVRSVRSRSRGARPAKGTRPA